MIDSAGALSFDIELILRTDGSSLVVGRGEDSPACTIDRASYRAYDNVQRRVQNLARQQLAGRGGAASGREVDTPRVAATSACIVLHSEPAYAVIMIAA